METAIDVFFLFTGTVFALALAYLYFLAGASLWPKREEQTEPSPQVKFAVLIPAHNEEKVVERTIQSIRKSSYPKELYTIYVLADNCTDNTVRIASEAGAICWERTDPEKKGKGYVLDWAFKKVLEESGFEAAVIIDADTVMDRNFLEAINKRTLSGALAVQGYYDVLNPERSPMGSLSYLGFVLTRNLRYKGRTRLGWTSNLLGNGMCFKREIIKNFGWKATSIVEDIEYEMMLLLQGVRVAFEPEARIYAEIPETFGRSEVQRGRWDLGKFQVRNFYIPKLIKEGIRRKDPAYFDAALELLIPPFSLFVMLLILFFFLYVAIGTTGFVLNIYVWLFVILALGIYIFGGLLFANTSPKVYLNLIYAPYFILWRAWVIFRGVFSRNNNSWIKTERK